MKTFAILTAAAAAICTLNISAVSAQQACMQDYQACMSSCAGKPVKALQDGCFNNCETKNNMCAERIYGKRPFNGAPSNVAEQRGVAKDALAKKEKPQEAQQQVAEDERAQQQPPQQQQQQQAQPPQRGPAQAPAKR